MAAGAVLLGDPIAAVATVPGPARRAVIRLSGPELLPQADRFLPPACPRPELRRGVHHGRLFWHPEAPVEVDLLVFPGPASATGEDVLELHLPGAPAVVDGVLEQLYANGLRPAEPGEFTRRAFLNGRLDLAQAEAVLALVQARSAGAARQAAAMLAGQLGDGLRQAREALAEALAEMEASLDFEEGDAQDLQAGEVEALFRQARESLQAGLRSQLHRNLDQEGWRIGLAGAPNAGKSQLFQRLTGRPVLVSAERGTTRDRIEGRWADGGEPPWILVDGPGWGAAADPRDAAAQALDQEVQVDLWWWLLDASAEEPMQAPAPTGAPCLVVWTHLDRGRRVPEAVVAEAAMAGPMVWTSSLDGTGLEDLRTQTAALLQTAATDMEENRSVHHRHARALEDALAALERAEAWRRDGILDLLAEDLRQALVALQEFSGRLSPEEVLDRIFSRFCIGK
ncbi:MAG: hypothetical protein DWQ01_02880 [Planctomycetota bacterium]|nr:MAG: hypothetical protein DWQ01_02880 [Planctomycetota bacterium]